MLFVEVFGIVVIGERMIGWKTQYEEDRDGYSCCWDAKFAWGL